MIGAAASLRKKGKGWAAAPVRRGSGAAAPGARKGGEKRARPRDNSLDQ